MAASKFVEILDDNSADATAQQHDMSECDVKLVDVLADHEHKQQQQRSRSSTQSSSSRKSQEDSSFDPRTSTGHDGADSASSSPSSSNTLSPTSSPLPRIKRLRKFTLTGGFSR